MNRPPRTPNTYPASSHAFTLIESAVLTAIVGLLVAIAVPNFVRSRESAQSQLCIHNLSRIDVAKVNWAISAGAESDTVPEKEDLEPYFSNDQFPACPAGGEYDFGTVSEPTLCSLVDSGHVSDAGAEEYEDASSSTPSGDGSSSGPKKPKPGRGKGKPPWL